MIQVPEAELERWMQAVSRALGGDFRDRPALPDGDGPWDAFCTGLRFLLDDLERADAKRRREVDAMRELDRLKTRFVNMAAHELGTPLTPIALQTHLLATTCSDLHPPQRRALAIVQRNVARMRRLVADLLDVARLENKELRLAREPVDLAALVLEAVETFDHQAERRGVQLTCRTEAVSVMGDGGRLAQVLDNLLGNALKVTPEGGRIHVELRRQGERAELHVQDTGIGLTAQQIAQLFRPFAQAHANVEGTGLGLFITRGIVERHGGLITCQSPGAGRGATFVVTLPADPCPGPGQGVAAAARAAHASPDRASEGAAAPSLARSGE
ncbi:MAG TPA: HAMP domain-containing sensor histidine kinase, partial [Candidatus Thermoplasmatota archaeon]|nr:HAMP domain-containing sensor histidine kinase [Candidatus Thermoplasmatota archaeon]